MKKLIVTADDAGLHPGMTLGALRAHEAGIVTAVSLAANGRAFEDAVEKLKDRPGLDAGVHLVLVGERPLSPPEEVRSLLGQDGALLPDFRAFYLRYVAGRIVRSEVEAELRRQVEKVLAAGLPIVHLNSHQHLHVLPEVFEIVLKLADEHRIPWVRIPCEPAVSRRRWSLRTAQLAALNHYGRRARRRAQGRISAPDRTVGVVDAGRLTVERLREALQDAEGVTELVCHPGVGDAALTAKYDWGYGWDRETEALCDPGLREALRRAGVEVVGFSDAAPR
ncbi:MAG TPA: ChbG/HpnK family deacetylase [Thermoanaerobaculia bacterium]